MAKWKLVKKYEQYKEKKGTVHEGESKTDKSQAQDCNIYSCLEKYGIQKLLNQTMATDFLYNDNLEVALNQKMDLAEAVRARNELKEYFKNQPAAVRKVFGDDVEVFIEEYRQGKWDKFLQTGVLNDELVAQLSGKSEISQPTGDLGETQIKKEIKENEQISQNTQST